MNDVKQRIINDIIGREGGFVDDPSDSGGATNYGITECVARNYHYDGDMCDLPRELAFEIYAEQYWHSVNGDQLADFSHALVEEVVDAAVNIGPSTAGRILQRCLNVFNQRGDLFPDIIVDGQIGPATLTALAGYYSQRSGKTLIKAINCLQGAFYIELAENREKDERFVYGWLKHRVMI